MIRTAVNVTLFSLAPENFLSSNYDKRLQHVQRTSQYAQAQGRMCLQTNKHLVMFWIIALHDECSFVTYLRTQCENRTSFIILSHRMTFTDSNFSDLSFYQLFCFIILSDTE